MNEAVYELYVFGKKLLKMMAAHEHELNDEELDFMADLKLTHTIMEEKCPDYAERYQKERNSVLLPE